MRRQCPCCSGSFVVHRTVGGLLLLPSHRVDGRRCRGSCRCVGWSLRGACSSGVVLLAVLVSSRCALGQSRTIRFLDSGVPNDGVIDDGGMLVTELVSVDGSPFYYYPLYAGAGVGFDSESGVVFDGTALSADLSVLAAAEADAVSGADELTLGVDDVLSLNRDGSVSGSGVMWSSPGSGFGGGGGSGGGSGGGGGGGGLSGAVAGVGGVVAGAAGLMGGGVGMVVGVACSVVLVSALGFWGVKALRG